MAGRGASSPERSGASLRAPLREDVTADRPRTRRYEDAVQNTFALSQSAAKNATKNGAIAHISGWISRVFPVVAITST
jgi:hypothetical protein